MLFVYNKVVIGKQALQTLYLYIVVKRKLNCKAMLSVYQLVYIPTLIYPHEPWVVTESLAAGPSFRDRVPLSRSKCKAADLSYQEEPVEMVRESGKVGCILGEVF